MYTFFSKYEKVGSYFKKERTVTPGSHWRSGDLWNITVNLTYKLYSFGLISLSTSFRGATSSESASFHLHFIISMPGNQALRGNRLHSSQSNHASPGKPGCFSCAFWKQSELLPKCVSGIEVRAAGTVSSQWDKDGAHSEHPIAEVKMKMLLFSALESNSTWCPSWKGVLCMWKLQMKWLVKLRGLVHTEKWDADHPKGCHLWEYVCRHLTCVITDPHDSSDSEPIPLVWVQKGGSDDSNGTKDTHLVSEKDQIFKSDLSAPQFVLIIWVIGHTFDSP